MELTDGAVFARPIGVALGKHRRIVLAVLLQDMQTRFGRGYFSYLVAVGWPLSHATFMMLGYLLLNSMAPVGDDPAIFVATGIVPYILCFYPGRTMPIIYFQNRQLLNLAAIRPIHIIAAGFLIEILTAVIVLTIIASSFAMAGVDVSPNDIDTACAAIAATIYLAVGVGVLNVALSALFGPFFIVVYIVVMIGLYVTAGVYIPTWMVPEPIHSYMLYNPLLNLVEWLRSAYYASYDPDLVNKPLVLGTATVALFLGLLGERFLRNKFYVL